MTRTIDIEFGLDVPSTVNLEFDEGLSWLESSQTLSFVTGGGTVNIEENLPLSFLESTQVDSGAALSQQWIDERVSTLVEDDTLFSFESGELRTVNEETNIVSHFVGTELAAGDPALWAGYSYTGFMKRFDSLGGIGVAFHSQHPGTAGYYRIRMFATDTTFNGNFHVSGPSGLVGTRDSGVLPTPGLWYEYRVVVDNLGVPGVRIRANVWENDDGLQAEPAGFQMDVTDPSGAYTSGTVGAWSMGSGEKRWKDLAINESGAFETLPMVEPLSLQLTIPTSFISGADGDTAQLTATLFGGQAGTVDVTSDVTWASSSPTHLTISASGLATAADPGTSASVTITAVYLGLTATGTILVTSAAGSSGSYQDQVTIDAITWFFDQPYLVEEIILGKKIVRPELSTGAPAPNNEVVVTQVNPAPTGTRNGSMIDPPTDVGRAQAYDIRAAASDSWEPSYGVTYPVGLKANQSLCSTRSADDTEWVPAPAPPGFTYTTGQFGRTDEQKRLTDFSVLTCLPRVNDGGPTVDTDTFRPRYVTNSSIADDKPVHSFSTIDIASLPAFPFQGTNPIAPGYFFWNGGNVNPYLRYKRSCERDWMCHMQDWMGWLLHPSNNMEGYWEYYADGLCDAMVLALITDPTTVPNGSGGFCTPEQREDLLRCVLQIGLDQYYCGELLGGAGQPYPPAPPGYAGSGTQGSFSTDRSHYAELSYIVSYLLGLPTPVYRHAKPDAQCKYHTEVHMPYPSSSTDAPGTSGSPDLTPVGATPSAEAQVMIGTGASFQPVDPSGLPAIIEDSTQPIPSYPWIGMAAQSNRDPSKLTVWRRTSNNPSPQMSECSNPREWDDLKDRGSASRGGQLESYRRSTVHIYPAGAVCSQQIIGRTEWEAMRSNDAYIDYVERWMFREQAVHAQNEGYVAETQSHGSGYSIGGEQPPGRGGSGFVTNMFLANYEYVY